MDAVQMTKMEQTALEEKRKELENQLYRMRCELKNFSQKPDIAQLLQERENLQRQSVLFAREIQWRTFNVKNRSIVFNNKKIVVRKSQLKKYFEENLQRFQNRILKKHPESGLLEYVTKMVGDVMQVADSPLAAMEWKFAEENVKDTKAIHKAQLGWAKAYERIEKIEIAYKNGKKTLPMPLQKRKKSCGTASK